MYCTNCGSEIEDGAKFCTVCGRPSEPRKTEIKLKSTEKVSVVLSILSVLFPVVGLIFFLVWKKERPRQSKVSGICALVAFLAEIFVSLVVGLSLVIFNFAGNSIFDSSTPAPAAPVYEDTKDGVLTFAEFGGKNKTCYDSRTDSLIVWSVWHVSVYDRADKKQSYSYDYTNNISCVSAYNGTLCVGFGAEKRIEIIDLATGESRTVTTEIEVAEIAVTDGSVVYCDSDQWCNVAVLSLSDNITRYVNERFYSPKIAINHENKIIYVVERGLSSCGFILVKLETLNYTEVSKFGEYQYNREGVYYDGQYVHAFGNTYNGITGAKVADSGHVESGTKRGLQLTNTLYRNEKISLISENSYRTVVHDNKTNKIIYTMNLTATEIYYAGGDTYIASCGDSGYVAFIDLSKVKK